MKVPDKPINEVKRIQVLDNLNILDTDPQENFDQITRLAKKIFQVEIALVSLIDSNRQWFKSKAGLEASETAREISFCGHAILNNQVFVVTDAQKDHRFFDNPLVTAEPYIRFYAGAPLMIQDNINIGTLCLIDSKPRELSAHEQSILEDLANIVVKEVTALNMVMLDELTQLANRRAFLLLAKQSLSICTRNAFSASVLFIDLDNFKSINDQFGHAEGDNALIEFSNILAQECRESDIVARLGGDEFVVFLTQFKPADINEIIHRLTKRLDSFNKQNQADYSLSFTYGVAHTKPEQAASIENLLKQADQDMYQNKSAS